MIGFSKELLVPGGALSVPAADQQAALHQSDFDGSRVPIALTKEV